MVVQRRHSAHCRDLMKGVERVGRDDFGATNGSSVQHGFLTRSETDKGELVAMGRRISQRTDDIEQMFGANFARCSRLCGISLAPEEGIEKYT